MWPRYSVYGVQLNREFKTFSSMEKHEILRQIFLNKTNKRKFYFLLIVYILLSIIYVGLFPVMLVLFIHLKEQDFFKHGYNFFTYLFIILPIMSLIAISYNIISNHVLAKSIKEEQDKKVYRFFRPSLRCLIEFYINAKYCILNNADVDHLEINWARAKPNLRETDRPFEQLSSFNIRTQSIKVLKFKLWFIEFIFYLGVISMLSSFIAYFVIYGI